MHVCVESRAIMIDVVQEHEYTVHRHLQHRGGMHAVCVVQLLGVGGGGVPSGGWVSPTGATSSHVDVQDEEA
jgi:hypothetical protein